ncbi:MAG: hypothetical protein ACK6EB_06425, partial [Planctomyces sp.]
MSNPKRIQHCVLGCFSKPERQEDVALGTTAGNQNAQDFSGQSLVDIFNEHANSFSGRLCHLLLGSVKRRLNESSDKYLSLLGLGFSVRSLMN